MSAQALKIRRSVVRRIKYLLRESKLAGHREVGRFAQRLSELGDVAVVGGVLRHFSLEGTSNFRSDVDFVIDPVTLRAFDRVMIGLGAKTNRFGGYSLQLDKWLVDAWPLQRTWAAQQGYIEIQGLKDVLRATFFDCDAIMYMINDPRLLFLDGYFRRIEQKVIDINFEPNPNPIGNTVRALRYSLIFGLKFGTRLAQFVLDNIDENGLSSLKKYELSSFGTQYLASLERKNLIINLKIIASGLPLNDVLPAGQDLDFAGFLARKGKRPGPRQTLRRRG